jgi:hypothetical protein
MPDERARFRFRGGATSGNRDRAADAVADDHTEWNLQRQPGDYRQDNSSR